MDFYNYAPGMRTLLTQKITIKNSNEQIIGVFGQALDITDINIFKPCFKLNISDQRFICTSGKSASYILDSEHSPLPSITPRQQSILFLLIRIKTMKEVAYILGISMRTVESHIASIKHKLGCHTKSQIIEKAIDSGFLYYIPKELFFNNRSPEDER